MNKIKFECKCGLTHHLDIGTKEYACRFCKDPYVPADAPKPDTAKPDSAKADVTKPAAEEKK